MPRSRSTTICTDEEPHQATRFWAQGPSNTGVFLVYINRGSPERAFNRLRFLFATHTKSTCPTSPPILFLSLIPRVSRHHESKTSSQRLRRGSSGAFRGHRSRSAQRHLPGRHLCPADDDAHGWLRCDLPLLLVEYLLPVAPIRNLPHHQWLMAEHLRLLEPVPDELLRPSGQPAKVSKPLAALEMRSRSAFGIAVLPPLRLHDGPVIVIVPYAKEIFSHTRRGGYTATCATRYCELIGTRYQCTCRGCNNNDVFSIIELSKYFLTLAALMISLSDLDADDIVGNDNGELVCHGLKLVG